MRQNIYKNTQFSRGCSTSRSSQQLKRIVFNMVESKKRIVGIVSAGRVVAYVGHAGGLDSSVSFYLGMKTALGGFTRLCVAAEQQR